MVMVDSSSMELAKDAYDDDGRISRTGTLWTCIAHIITGVIGSGVLSLAWSISKLGWILGPICLISFAIVTYISSSLLSDCYRSPDPVTGKRNYCYTDAVRVNLASKTKTWCCGFLQVLSFYLTGVAYVRNSEVKLLSQGRSWCSMFIWQGDLHAALWNSPDNGHIQGSITGAPAANTADKVWLAFQAIGDIAFAYPKFLYVFIKLYSQPTYALVERWFAKKYPNNDFVTKFYSIKLPSIPSFQVNLLRICFRTCYVASTTAIGIIFPYFNQILGVLGAVNFWPLAVYFPVEMYIVQKKIEAWTRTWVILKIFCLVCLLISLISLIGSIQGLVSAKFGN
ncbi:hypothetical protein ACFE04_024465 [Oxalis oulophora]